MNCDNCGAVVSFRSRDEKKPLGMDEFRKAWNARPASTRRMEEVCWAVLQSDVHIPIKLVELAEAALEKP